MAEAEARDMALFARTRRTIIPANVWEKCKSCEEALYRKELEKNLFVCPKCNYHFRLSLHDRIAHLADEGTFEEFDAQLSSADPLAFEGNVPYRERLRASKEKTSANEAITTGFANLAGHPIVLGVLNFDFMGGSMGSVVGEKIVRACERAIEHRRPLIIVSTSGGARMDEGILSLMQMIKTSQAIADVAQAHLPYVSLLTDPTTGGVTASFAMLGDIVMAEPGALIGFAGPRVIEQTIKQTLPKGFQRAEFLVEKGVIDMVVPRHEVKPTLGRILSFFSGNGQVQ